MQCPHLKSIFSFLTRLLCHCVTCFLKFCQWQRKLTLGVVPRGSLFSVGNLGKQNQFSFICAEPDSSFTYLGQSIVKYILVLNLKLFNYCHFMLLLILSWLSFVFWDRFHLQTYFASCKRDRVISHQWREDLSEYYTGMDLHWVCNIQQRGISCICMTQTPDM